MVIGCWHQDHTSATSYGIGTCTICTRAVTSRWSSSAALDASSFAPAARRDQVLETSEIVGRLRALGLDWGDVRGRPVETNDIKVFWVFLGVSVLGISQPGLGRCLTGQSRHGKQGDSVATIESIRDQAERLLARPRSGEQRPRDRRGRDGLPGREGRRGVQVHGAGGGGGGHAREPGEVRGTLPHDSAGFLGVSGRNA